MLVREPFEQDFTNQGHSPWLRHAYAEAWHRSARAGPHAGRMPHYEGGAGDRTDAAGGLRRSHGRLSAMVAGRQVEAGLGWLRCQPSRDCNSSHNKARVLGTLAGPVDWATQPWAGPASPCWADAAAEVGLGHAEAGWACLTLSGQQQKRAGPTSPWFP
ncbi:hypothetical protein TIFTF001_045065 [Ficus carica]|uniref:Uncharacterized protein n=1 Tax=Ficus carica TaxID=3494 RepID=A0AA88CIQ6_FICCA|nr:hypothetical protein TIFTF001_045065 [Ficus carica]